MSYLTSSLEDYLKAIWIINLDKKVVRVKDIVEKLGVKASSVVEAMNNLKDKDLVNQEKYGYIELTSEGARLAKDIYKKHKSLYRFIRSVLGVDINTAEEDACRIEHYVSKETLDRIIKFIEFIDNCPEGKPVCLSNFQKFVKSGIYPEPCKKNINN